MTKHNLFYYPYALFTNAQLPLLKVAALWFDRLVILDPVDASWAIIGLGYYAQGGVIYLKGAGIPQTVTLTDILMCHSHRNLLTST